MGASDYRKINDQWTGGEENRQKLDEFYTSDAPSTGKLRSRKHGNKKSNHKHIYEDVILICSNGKHLPCRGRHCTICGKVDMIGFFTKKTEAGYTQLMTYKEVMNEYKDLPVIEGDWI